MVIFPRFLGDEKSKKHLDDLLGEYNRCWYELDELIYTKPVKLHVHKFEEFFFSCIEFHPRAGYEHWHDLFKHMHQRDDKQFNEVKENAYVVIDDLIEFVESQKNTIGKRKGVKTINLYLNTIGDLWREPKNKYCYPMGQYSDRHKVIRCLATNSGFQKTQSISMALNNKSEQSIRTEIGKIRSNIQKFLGIDGKKVLEGRKESGYRISSLYPITLKKE